MICKGVEDTETCGFHIEIKITKVNTDRKDTIVRSLCVVI